MATVMKASKNLPVKKKVSATKKSVSSDKASKTSKLLSKQKKPKALTRAQYLKKLYPVNLSTEDKLNQVLQYAEVEIFDVVRRRLVEVFNSNEFEFESLIKWLLSSVGKKYLDENHLLSIAVVESILQHSKGQYETDAMNEDYASLPQTACYVFDESYALFPEGWCEPNAESLK
jgi:hypothetical protein